MEWQGIIILDKNFFVVQLTEILQTILSEGVCKYKKLSGLGGVRSQKLSGRKAVILPISHSRSLSSSPLPPFLPPSFSISLSLFTPLSALRNMWSFICMAALSFSFQIFCLCLSTCIQDCPISPECTLSSYRHL